MKYRSSIFSLLALATIAYAATAGTALAGDDRFNRFSNRTASVHDSARPYQRQTSAASTARTIARTDGFNDRGSHVQDSTRPYQQRQPVMRDRVVAHEALFNRFSERTAPIRDSQRPYQFGAYTAQR